MVYTAAPKISCMHVLLYRIMIDSVNIYKLSISNKKKTIFKYKKSGNCCHVVDTSFNCFHNHLSLLLTTATLDKKNVRWILEVLVQDRRKIVPYIRSQEIVYKFNPHGILQLTWLFFCSIFCIYARPVACHLM